MKQINYNIIIHVKRKWIIYNLITQANGNELVMAWSYIPEGNGLVLAIWFSCLKMLSLMATLWQLIEYMSSREAQYFTEGLTKEIFIV